MSTVNEGSETRLTPATPLTAPGASRSDGNGRGPRPLPDEATADAEPTRRGPRIAPRDRRAGPRHGRLAGKIALVTGAAGNIGDEICRRYLREGATLVMCGRDAGKLTAARERLLREARAAGHRALVVPMDAGDPGQVRAGVERVMARYGRIDIVVNNAGSAGPKQRLSELPISYDELDALQRAGSSDTETVADAARNLLGVAWNVVRAVTPHLKPGATIINVSTIFSRTQYFGRAAYVVPKAALNAFSRRLAQELGPRGIRVNTVFPGPIQSERIRTVFAAMDTLRASPAGTTQDEFFRLMTLHRPDGDGTLVPTFPTVDDVAATIVYLGSEESAAINGHNFEVTHGMLVRQESRSTWASRPELRTVDGSGVTVLIAAGDQVADALAIARAQARCGAEVILGLGSEEGVRSARDALGMQAHDGAIRVRLFDRTRKETMDEVLQECSGECASMHAAIILPAFGAWRFRGAFAEATDADVAAFIDAELSGSVAIARQLTRFWTTCPSRQAAPRVVFITNGSDGGDNHYADMLRAAVEELCRVWRDEAEVERQAGQRAAGSWANQIVRWSNDEDEELPFAAGQAARLLYTARRINQVNLYLPRSIVEATGARKASFGWMESLMGLHLGTVALITGGSAGIGGQIGRLLAIAGGRVMLVARRRDQLDEFAGAIRSELEHIGYLDVGGRVQTMDGVDVADEASLALAVEETMRRFGRIDYLINNAGVAGAEEMVVDMPVDAWRYTLNANLISNFSLMAKCVPLMKAQGRGYILNVSSYFGGEKYIAVPYPNRADYAVSKAGQRALVESLARFVGPEIQLNAIAPGPVAGDRLRGTGGKPGLFERRARLIFENRRLNAIYAAIVETLRLGGSTAGAMLDVVGGNDVQALGARIGLPAPMATLAQRAARDGAEYDGEPSCGRYLMNPGIARKLVQRLKAGGWFLADDDRGTRFDAAWIEGISEPPEPFCAPELIAKEATKIRDGVLGMLHLHNMPTEHEVALATVYFMADRAVSGETFQPSGGLHQERTITERELFGGAKAERLEAMQGATVWLIGESLVPHLTKAARAFIEQCRVGRVVLLMQSAAAAEQVVSELRDIGGDEVLRTILVDAGLERAMDEAIAAHGPPQAVISTPFDPVPAHVFSAPAGQAAMDAAGFGEFVEAQVTHHFRVARKVSLMDGVRLVLVGPDLAINPTQGEFALANFVKTSLHALTATLGVENERLVHGVPVNQINLTRRVRSEEPRDAEERAEELDRFARAVLLASAPLPGTEDSRYRSRIYRGMAITV